MGSVPPPTNGDSNAQRRSQRVMIKVSVLVLAEGAENKPVSEERRTVTVNAHGAMVLLGLKVSIGQLLTSAQFENGRRGRSSRDLCEPSRIGAETSRRRLYGAWSPVLAHLVSST